MSDLERDLGRHQRDASTRLQEALGLCFCDRAASYDEDAATVELEEDRKKRRGHDYDPVGCNTGTSTSPDARL